MKKIISYISGIIILIIILNIFLINSSPNTTNEISQLNQNQIQEITIGIKDLNYYPQTIKVKVGIPVQIKLDESVKGCFRDFSIKSLNLRKYLKNLDDTLIFTPQNPGTYTFSCGMGMGTGKLIIEK